MDKHLSPIESEFLKKQYYQIFKLKNNDFFSLLNIKFYAEEISFFSKIALFFAETNNVDRKKAIEFGLISSLVYMSTKIHYTIDCEKDENFLGGMQFPILLGDLLYGKIIESISLSSSPEVLKDYLHYLQTTNAAIVDYLDNKIDDNILDEKFYEDLVALTISVLGIDTDKTYTLSRQIAHTFGVAAKNKQAVQFEFSFENNEQEAYFYKLFDRTFIFAREINSLADLQ